MNTREYRFGSFSLRPAQRELLAAGARQKLGRRGYDLLLALVERAGEVVTREELFDRVWRGRVVIDDNLKVQVMALRGLLGADAIVTIPGHGYRFALPVATDGDARAAAPVVAAPAPAAADSLIGRDADLAQLLALLQRARLVTVAGSGGVGKTRLALAAAAAAASHFDDGATVVELAGLREPHLLCGTVARRLRLPQEGERLDAASLAQALAPLSLLLVLDNCEHVLDAAADLAAALLAQAPRVAVLATSQEPLGVQREHVVRLGGLGLPADAAPAEEVAASAAPRLLAERIRSADAAFAIDATNAGAVAALCRRLDGIPLALELAAARVPLLGLDGVLARIDEQLGLLSRGARDAPSRQRTLRGALQWSHALLDAHQKAAFRRLAVFADTFAIDAAERICTAPGDDRWQMLDALQALVDKSLVASAAVGSTSRRLRLLVAAREFAAEHLNEAGERDATQARHADAVLAIFEQSLGRINDDPLLPWLERLAPEVADLRAALRWAADADPARLVALAGAAGYYWNAAGLHREAERWLPLARRHLGEQTQPLHAARLWQALAYRSVDPTAPIADALDAARRAAALLRDLGDAPGEYRMLGLLAHHARRVEPPLDVDALFARMRTLERPDWSPALLSARLRPEGIALARAGRWQAYRDHFAAESMQAEARGDELWRWGCQHHLSLADLALGEPARGAAGMRPVVQRLRELGYLRWQWTRPAILLMALIEAGETDEAAASMHEIIGLLRVAGAPDWMPEHMALWALGAGFVEDGASLLGWSDGVVERKRDDRSFHQRQVLARVERQLAARLDAQRLAALRSAGRGWDDATALHRVLALAARCAAGTVAQAG